MFGAWAPFPLRLGPDAQRGWSAAAHARMAADLAAAKRTVPLARVTVVGTAITDYVAQHGSGLAVAPTISVITDVRLKWQATYQDWAGVPYPWRIRSVHATVLSTSKAALAVDLYPSSTWDVIVSFSAGSSVELAVYGDWLPERQIGDYDGATDKTDSLTEGDSSYFYEWFLELQAMRGSAYSKGPGYVDAENFAIARQLGALSRASEKLENNSLPGTSDEKLEAWQEALGLPERAAEQRWQARLRAEAKFRAMASANIPSNIDEAVRTLLGPACVAIHRNIGTQLSAPPTLTYWPGVNPGPVSYSLGGGAWLSERSHYWVEIQQPPTMNAVDFRRLIGVDLFELLDTRLPAHMTMGWATSSGFLLDISQLDFDGL